jgi:hypothetical protein
VTHPFHPLCGQDFEFVAYRQNWGEDRVHLHDENGQLFSLPAAWTDAVAADPFVVIAAGRAPFTTAGLLALAARSGGVQVRLAAVVGQRDHALAEPGRPVDTGAGLRADQQSRRYLRRCRTVHPNAANSRSW